MRTRLVELAAELGTTDRTLRRALQQGLVRARRDSPRTLDVAASERAYLRRAWALLSSLRRALRTEPGVTLAVLFGSRARGDDRPGSDVDLLLDLRAGTDRRAVAARLSDQTGLRVRVLTLDDAWRAPLVLAEVLRDGRALVDRDAQWPASSRSEDDSSEQPPVSGGGSSRVRGGLRARAGCVTDDRAARLELTINERLVDA
jgi:predicted nucleotidyltransferase